MNLKMNTINIATNWANPKKSSAHHLRHFRQNNNIIFMLKGGGKHVALSKAMYVGIQSPKASLEGLFPHVFAIEVICGVRAGGKRSFATISSAPYSLHTWLGHLQPYFSAVCDHNATI